MSDEMTQREKDLFACTELLVKTILDRKWFGASVKIEVRVEVPDPDVLTINISMSIV